MLRRTAYLLVFFVLAACPDRNIVPLIGEDPEVLALIGAPPPEDPSTSPLAAARRLHQALNQQDMELAWTLLAAETRAALDTLGATVGQSGRELMDSSLLPDATGKLTRVRFVTVLLGPDPVSLELQGDPTPDADRSIVRVICRTGEPKARTFVRDQDGYKLLVTEF